MNTEHLKLLYSDDLYNLGWTLGAIQKHYMNSTMKYYVDPEYDIFFTLDFNDKFVCAHNKETFVKFYNEEI